MEVYHTTLKILKEIERFVVNVIGLSNGENLYLYGTPFAFLFEGVTALKVIRKCQVEFKHDRIR